MWIGKKLRELSRPPNETKEIKPWRKKVYKVSTVVVLVALCGLVVQIGCAFAHFYLVYWAGDILMWTFGISLIIRELVKPGKRKMNGK